MLIISLSNESKMVDPDSIGKFSTSKNQIWKHLEEELENTMEDAKNAFMELKAFHDILPPDDSLRKKSTAHQIDQYQHLVSQMFGQPTTTSIESIRKNENAAELAKGIEKYITDGQAQESIQEVSGYLKKITTLLDKPENQGKSLNELIATITNELTENSEKERKEMQERIKKSAKDAISISLDKVGFEVFKGVKND
ncbi:MAG: hypothetical protein MJE63_24915 [Proteobacteria bacterium]|nr:hypothetical protein [Pseudomonadota bacterium]